MLGALFFFFAAIAVGAALLVILHRNPVYNALFLIVSLFALAGLYVLLNAPFIAAIHIIVYAGAIMVLFLFVIMLIDLKKSGERVRNIKSKVLGLLVAGALAVQLCFLFWNVSSLATSSKTAISTDTAAVGRALFTRFLFPFEVASILILSALVGAVLLAKLKFNE